MARFAFARTLIGGVGGDGHVAEFGEALRIEAGDLFLDAAVRMRDDHGREGLLAVVVGRRVDVRGDLEAVQLVGHGMNVDVARKVFGDGSAVDESEGIRSGRLIGGAGNAGDPHAGGSGRRGDGFLRHFVCSLLRKGFEMKAASRGSG